MGHPGRLVSLLLHNFIAVITLRDLLMCQPFPRKPRYTVIGTESGCQSQQGYNGKVTTATVKKLIFLWLPFWKSLTCCLKIRTSILPISSVQTLYKTAQIS